MSHGKQVKATHTGQTRFVLVTGTVHLQHSRPRFRVRNRKTMCGEVLVGTEQAGIIDLSDAANLHALNVCPCCMAEFKRKGHFKLAIAAYTASLSINAPARHLPGQLGLFDR